MLTSTGFSFNDPSLSSNGPTLSLIGTLLFESHGLQLEGYGLQPVHQMQKTNLGFSSRWNGPSSCPTAAYPGAAQKLIA
jgi:hypothetical protein